MTSTGPSKDEQKLKNLNQYLFRPLIQLIPEDKSAELSELKKSLLDASDEIENPTKDKAGSSSSVVKTPSDSSAADTVDDATSDASPGVSDSNVSVDGKDHSTTGDISGTKFISPHVGEQISALKDHEGQPRDKMTAPIAPEFPVLDTHVFEDPHDPSIRFYLPRYSIAEVNTDKGPQFRIRLEAEGNSTKLTVVLTPEMPPEIKKAWPQARPLEHQITGVLKQSLPDMSSAHRQWDLKDQRVVDNGIELSITVSSLFERNALYLALIGSPADTTFTVHRSAVLSVPCASVIDTPEGEVVTYMPLEDRVLALQAQRFRAQAVRIKHRAGERDVPRLKRQLDVVKTSSIANVQHLGTVVTPHAQDIIAEARSTADQDATSAADDSTVWLYRATTKVLEYTLPHTFIFDRQMYGYIYGNLPGVVGAQAGMVRDQVWFGDRPHSYYYSHGDPEVVFYLPDAFKLARRPEKPRIPMMSVGFDSPDGDPTTSTATVGFSAAAVVRQDRLWAASQTIAQTQGFDLSRLRMQPLLADSSGLSLSITLPGKAGRKIELLDATIDLRTALNAFFKLPMDDFQSIFSKLHSTTPLLFTGTVEVKTKREDQPAELVPLVVSMTDLFGDIIEVETGKTGPETYYARISNIIESPLTITDMAGVLPQQDGYHIELFHNQRLPVTLLPEASVACALRPRYRPRDHTYPPQIHIRQMFAQPDPEAIWAAICESDSSYYERTLTVVTDESMFSPAEGAPTIKALLVHIQTAAGGSSTTAVLQLDALKTQVTITSPISDVVLRKGDPSSYRYQVRAIVGDTKIDGPWKTETSDYLWITRGDLK